MLDRQEVYSILETHVAPYLEIEEFTNVLMTTKDLYKNNQCWNYYFFELFKYPVEFILNAKNLRDWKYKNLYDKTDKIFTSKRKLKMYQKTKLKSIFPVMDYFFPKYIFEKTDEKQIFIDKNGKLVQWDGYYFEIYFPIMIHNEEIQIGFCQEEHYDKNLIGWNKNSIGLHMDDLHVYYRTEKLFMKKITKYDKETFFLGAGIDFKTNTFFFTINGKKIMQLENPFETIEYFKPVFTSKLNHLHFIFNEGKKPFHFDLKN